MGTWEVIEYSGSLRRILACKLIRAFPSDGAKIYIRSSGKWRNSWMVRTSRGLRVVLGSISVNKTRQRKGTGWFVDLRAGKPHPNPNPSPSPFWPETVISKSSTHLALVL